MYAPKSRILLPTPLYFNSWTTLTYIYFYRISESAFRRASSGFTRSLLIVLCEYNPAFYYGAPHRRSSSMSVYPIYLATLSPVRAASCDY